jgi:hypothetical protein
VTASAPRYDRRLLAAIRRLDDEGRPIAETCRRVGEVAARLGVPRPSYVHIRRIVVAERQLKHERRELENQVAAALLAGRLPRAGAALERVREAEEQVGAEPIGQLATGRAALWL